MSVSGQLRRAYEASPQLLKTLSGACVGMLPPGARYGRAYRLQWAAACHYELIGPSERHEAELASLRAYLTWAGECVPYYRELFGTLAFKPGAMRSLEEIEELPLLRKADVLRLGDALQPDRGPTESSRLVSTGGTSGSPLALRMSYSASAREWASVQHLWRRVGVGPYSRRAVLRGQLVMGRTRGRYVEREAINRALLFSSVDLSQETVGEYAKHIRAFAPDYLHAYPSSASYLCALLGTSTRPFPSLKGVLLSSENFTDGQRAQIRETLGVPAYSLYGLTEKVVLAAECTAQQGHHLAPLHSHVEVVDEMGAAIHESGRTGTVVGTGLVNAATALVRYVTDDEAAWSDTTCPCGITGRRLVSLVGHRSVECLLAVDGSEVPATAFLHAAHGAALSAIARLRFVQTTPGEASMEVELKPGAASEAALAAHALIAERLDGRVALALVVRDRIPAEESGKFKFVVRRDGCAVQ